MAQFIKHFEVVEAAGYGYSTVWTHRKALIRLASLPFFIKIGSYALILFFGMEDNFLRHGLILLPSYFADGFMLAYVIRMVMGGYDLGGDFSQGQKYARDIMAATVVYVLIQLSLAFFVGSFLTGVTAGAELAETENSPATPPSLGSFIGAMLFLAGTLWAFRLLWLYVPMAMGLSVKGFLRRISPYSSSFRLIGCWLMCFVPFAIGLLLMAQILSAVFPQQGGEESQGFSLAFSLIQSAVEITISLVSSLAMAYGVKQIMESRG